MGHPKVINHTAFEFAPLFLADANGRPLFVPLLKASFVIAEDGRLLVAAKQPAISIGGEPWGPADISSYRLEPEGVIAKPATDIVLNGHAHAPGGSAVETVVHLRVGNLRKTVQVTGDRVWRKRAGIAVMDSPKPFSRMPLKWERAFGGWDRSATDPQEHRCEARNPVGLGFRNHWNDKEPQVALPNLEHPDHLIRSFDDRPPPAGFGFVSSNWQPRLALAGTYDEAWLKTRMPLLPADFDPRFLNAAPTDQVVHGYLQGTEDISVLNASPQGTLSFPLPGRGTVPRFEVTLRDGGATQVTPLLDTLIIDTDIQMVSLLWRANVPVLDVPNDVVSIELEWGRRVASNERGGAGA